MSRSTSCLADLIDSALETTVVGSFSQIGFHVRARMFGFQHPLAAGVKGRRFLVTGANSGLGFATTYALLRHGASVIATTRSAENSRTMRRQLDAALDEPAADRLITDEVDLADLQQVRQFASRHATTALDTVIHNAGALSETFTRTSDGHELTVQVHVLAPFLLTAMLRNALEQSGSGQVITVTSGGLYAAQLPPDLFHGNSGEYNGTRAYAVAKRAQLVLTSEWQRRFGSPRLSFYAVHPGWVNTPGLKTSLPGFEAALRPVLRTPAAGIDTILHVAAARPQPAVGRVFHDRRARYAHRLPTTFTPRGRAGQLWADVCRLSEIDPYR